MKEKLKEKEKERGEEDTFHQVLGHTDLKYWIHRRMTNRRKTQQFGAK